jgi:hypothetical protein
MLIKRIEEEKKEEARRRRRFIEHKEFEKDYRHVLADEKIQRQRENPENAAKEEYREFLALYSRVEPKTKRYDFNKKGEIIDINKRLIVPQIKVKEILIENHDHMLAGHLGIAKTISRIKRH